MKLGTTDYLLAVACKEFSPVLKLVGDYETRWLKAQLTNIQLASPVFITGLARSGTTILLTILSQLPGLATHKYRDFPFVFLPYFWNRFTQHFAGQQQTTERPHKDGIQISPDSPDAFEEPIWQHFFPQVHDRKSVHILDEHTTDPDFEQFFRNHIRKTLLVRGGSRYLSKGNYNIMRIAYLAKLFPDARFIIPIRHPFNHVESLVRQHQLFSGYVESDPRIGKYLRAAGHYEFGPQRVPVGLSPDVIRRTETAWQAHQEHRGYAIQWQAIYDYVQTLREEPTLAKQIMILRFEDMCQQPEVTLQMLLDFLEIDSDHEQTRQLATIIKQPSIAPDSLHDRHKVEIMEEVATCARDYDYLNT